MDPKEFCIRGKQMVDYIIDYTESLDKRRKVFPEVKPGYLRPLLPNYAPEEAESFEDVIADLERVIMPGMTHWSSPHFHAYFPSMFSYPSLLAEMMITATSSVGFSWAHSSVERAAIIGAVRVRKLPSDEKFSMRGVELEKVIAQDKANGLVPFYLCATLGTTSSCAFDNILELGPICQREGIWMHIDAAYAGSAFICPEFRPLLNGVEFADSFDFNAYKWMRVSFDCSPMWVKCRKDIINSLKMEPPYLKHIHDESGKGNKVLIHLK
uniref:Aromatic-L-amino-acid decarboxylase n=1 Tax=Eptatretus burgeri TaxID=7764 RepID=A0A8C4X0W2_EPTBU